MVEVVEVMEGLENKKVRPAISSLAIHLSGGEFCRRGRNFVDFALPSSTVIQHLDVNISVLYEFFIQCLGLMSSEMRDFDEESRSRKRRREEEEARSRSRKRR